MKELHIDTSRCKGCGFCIEACPKNALEFSGYINAKGNDTVAVDKELCIQCGSCYKVCPDYVFEIY